MQPSKLKQLKEKQVVISPFIASIAVSIYTVLSLTIKEANTLTQNLSRFLLLYVPLPLDILMYVLSPYIIGLAGLALMIMFIYKSMISKAIAVLTIVYLYNVIFSYNPVNTIPLYVSCLIVLLVSYGWIRGLHYKPTRITRGKARLSVSIMLEYIMIYIVTLAFSTWYTSLLSQLLYTLPSRLPYPLSIIYSGLMETRIGSLIITIVVFYTILWLINQIVETIILKLTITKDIALSMVKNEFSSLKSKLLVIESYGLLDYAASFLILLPLYPIIFTKIVNLFTPLTMEQDQLFNLIVHGFSFLIYLILARIVRGIFRSIVQGTIPFRALLISSIVFIVFVLALYISNGYNPLLVFDSVFKGKSLDYDPFKEYVLKFEERVTSIESYLRDFENLIRLIIYILWG